GCPKCGHEFVYRATTETPFGEKKVWKSYLVLEHYAKERGYSPIGLAKCIGFLVSYVNVSDTVARKILRKMAKEPYCFITMCAGQVVVEKRKVVEKNIKKIPKVLEIGMK
ncbi:unnamed protein product, partial [marine sediment metagenome]